MSGNNIILIVVIIPTICYIFSELLQAISDTRHKREFIRQLSILSDHKGIDPNKCVSLAIDYDLSDSEKNEIWKNKFEGKTVDWIGEIIDGELYSDGTMSITINIFFGRHHYYKKYKFKDDFEEKLFVNVHLYMSKISV